MENALDLSTCVQQFEEAEQATREAREKAERDRDYYDEKQWTEEERSTLEKRGQPAVTYNRIKRKVNAMLGLERQTRKDPKAFPRNPDDEQSAHAATDALRYVCDDNRWDDKRSAAAKDLAIEGTGVIKVWVKRTKEGIDPRLDHIRWDRFYHDPHSMAFDFADACYMGEVTWLDLDKAVASYPDAQDVLEATVNQAQSSETYDDTPKYRLWADYRRKRVRICEHYYKTPEGWQFCIFTKGGYLVEPMASPYQGEDGEPECPLKAASLYIDRDGNRYGEVRTMIGPQDEINKRRSKALHLISQRQARVSPNVADSPDKVRKELARPDGVFVGEKDDVEILPTNDMAAANLQLLQEAKAEIDLLGPNAALGGKNETDMSGRAILAQQQGGMNELSAYLDCVRTLSLAVYRSVWSRVRQHWTGPRWVRVTDDQRNMRFVGLNQPITLKMAMRQAAEGDAQAMQMLAQFSPQLPAMLEAAAAGDPNAQNMIVSIARGQGEQPLKIDNAVAELDVDIIVDEGIDSPTIAAEQFDQMLKLAGTGMVQIPPDVLIEASSLPNKDQLLERMRQPNPQAEMATQIQVAQASANVEKTQSETVKNLAQAQSQDPAAQMQLEAMKAEAQIGMAHEKQQHGMALAERKQMFGEQIASRQAEQRARQPKAA